MWQKFLFVDRTNMSAPAYGSYVETKNWDLKKPVQFKDPKGGWMYKRLDWGQSEPRKYFWKKLDDTHLEEGEYYGTMTFNQSLIRLFQAGNISLEDALAASDNPDDLKMQMRGITQGTASRPLGM